MNPKLKLQTIFFGNLIDTFATLYLYSTGLFVELNPIMAYLLHNPIAFILVKISVVTGFLLRLWHEREDKKAQIVINICAWIYGLIGVYYIVLLIIYFQVCQS